ncbi:MAG: zinc ribbon domain-containing protein [Desulfobacterales bacterium]|jgi:hypothetical protein
MKCPKCSFEQPADNVECLRCGVIFAKYTGRSGTNPVAKFLTRDQAEIPADAAGIIKSLFFYVKPETNRLIWGARLLLFLIILLWGLKLIFTSMESNSIGRSFWHLVNLPFHEAGHIFFRPFGRFMTSLGGTLGQLLMPLICLVVFIIKTRDPFAASFSLWWLGVNFMDIAPYINDARAGVLPLLGGNTGRNAPYGFHDWEFILNEAGLITYDHLLANFSYRLGSIIMLCAFFWGGYMLFKQHQKLS